MFLSEATSATYSRKGKELGATKFSSVGTSYISVPKICVVFSLICEVKASVASIGDRGVHRHRLQLPRHNPVFGPTVRLFSSANVRRC